MLMVEKQIKKSSEGKKGGGVAITCRRCKHQWVYTGLNPYFATCPRCRAHNTLPGLSVGASSKHGGGVSGGGGKKIKLVCQRCGHKWTYEGRNPWYVTCPFCKTKVTVHKQTTR